MRFVPLLVAHVGTCLLVACSAATSRDATSDRAGTVADAGGSDARLDVASPPEDGAALPTLDAGVSDVAAPFDPDAACASARVDAEVVSRPVDIVWVVDNSASMQPAVSAVQAGLVAFADLIGQRSLDYHVVMLSLRGAAPTTVGGKLRYPVCIPPPLAGDAQCGDGPRFVHASIDVKSTQPLEQLLGTLGQTKGYQPGDERGGEPWAGALRPDATKTIVVVTDDESRLTADEFEHGHAGTNPNNSSLELPAGLLEPSWNGAFDGYLFSSIYGWGSDTDPGESCTYPGGSRPPSSGPTYSELVARTGGVRAKICDGASAWSAFFDAVAQAVVGAAKISCELAIPRPDAGAIDPQRVNVAITSGGVDHVLPAVADATACGTSEAWYYDDAAAPSHVELCPAACDAVNLAAGAGKPGSVALYFGCETVLR